MEFIRVAAEKKRIKKLLKQQDRFGFDQRKIKQDEAHN